MYDIHRRLSGESFIGWQPPGAFSAGSGNLSQILSPYLTTSCIAWHSLWPLQVVQWSPKDIQRLYQNDERWNQASQLVHPTASETMPCGSWEGSIARAWLHRSDWAKARFEWNQVKSVPQNLQEIRKSKTDCTSFLTASISRESSRSAASTFTTLNVAAFRKLMWGRVQGLVTLQDLDFASTVRVMLSSKISKWWCPWKTVSNSHEPERAKCLCLKASKHAPSVSISTITIYHSWQAYNLSIPYFKLLQTSAAKDAGKTPGISIDFLQQGHVSNSSLHQSVPGKPFGFTSPSHVVMSNSSPLNISNVPTVAYSPCAPCMCCVG